MKDKIPKELQSNIVYRVNCSNCESSYIGKTIRQATRRLSEHGASHTFTLDFKAASAITTTNTDSLRRSKRRICKLMEVNPIDKSNNNINKTIKEHNSAIKQLELTTKHTINWGDWEILTKDKSHYRLLIKESLSITKYQPSLNKTTCSVPLIIYPEGLQSKKPKVKMKSMNHIPPERGSSIMSAHNTILTISEVSVEFLVGETTDDRFFRSSLIYNFLCQIHSLSHVLKMTVYLSKR